MRVLYMTWGEVPRLSSVYGGQVINVVRELQRHPAVSAAKLLAGVPIIHSGMVREKLAYFDQLRKIHSLIGVENFLWRSIPVPPVGLHPGRWQLPFFIAGQIGAVAKHIRAFNPDVVQCRSYVATCLAHAVRDRIGGRFRIVFDSRSYMPDEAVLTRRWSEGSLDHIFWKKQEKKLLTQSDLTTVVSEPMRKRFEALGARRCEVIHLNVDATAIETEKLKISDRLADDSPILAYCGYLSESSWHSPRSLWQVFSSFRAYRPKARLLVITKSNHSSLMQSLRDAGFGNLVGAIEFTSTAGPSATVQLLQTADIAVLSYRTPKNAHEELLAEGVFSTKTAEYLMAGLPVLVNRHCGGAREYVKNHRAGISYDPEQLLTETDVALVMSLACDRQRIAAEAVGHFSTAQNVGRLVELYAQLVHEVGVK